MLPTNENAVYDAVSRLSSNLMNNHVGNAYPQLVPVLQLMSMDLQNAFVQLLAAQRSELFYGKTPWAKLYTLQTGKQIGVPDGEAIIKNLTGDGGVNSPNRPFKQILEYFLAHRGYEDDEMVFNQPGSDQDQVTLDVRTGEAKVWWHNNDMTLRLREFQNNRAHLECPLFDEPYQVTVQSDYLHKMLYGPLYELIVGDEHREPTEPQLLLMHKYFGTREAPIDGSDSAFNQLKVLLSGDMYQKHNASYAVCDWRGYRLRLDTKRDWDFHAGNHVLYVSTVAVEKEGARDGYEFITNWHLNPLLVNDLLNDFDGIVDELLTKHELSMKEQ